MGDATLKPVGGAAGKEARSAQVVAGADCAVSDGPAEGYAVEADAAFDARFARFPRFFDLPPGVDAAERIGSLRIAVVGCGAVGTVAADNLARLSPSSLALIDRGAFKAESLATQAIESHDVGQPKAKTLAERLHTRHPHIAVAHHDGDVADLRDDAFAAFDLVLLATDNIRAELEVSRRCMVHRVPLFAAAVYGDALIAQVACFAMTDERSPCIACTLGESEWRHADRETLWQCAPAPDADAGSSAPGSSLAVGAGAAHNLTMNVAPTMSVAALSSLAANLAVVAVLRHALGLGESISDTLTQFCGYTFETVTMKLRRKVTCPAEHLPRRTIRIDEPLETMTLRELLRLVDDARRDIDAAQRDVSLQGRNDVHCADQKDGQCDNTHLASQPNDHSDHPDHAAPTNANENENLETINNLNANLRTVDTLAAPAHHADHAPMSVMVDESVFAERALCGCAEPRRIDRFVRTTDELGRCDVCDHPLRADAFGSHRRVPMGLLGNRLDECLQRLGASRVMTIVVRDESGETIVHGGADAQAR